MIHVKDRNVMQLRRSAMTFQKQHANLTTSALEKIDPDGTLHFVTRGESGTYKQLVRYKEPLTEVTPSQLLTREVLVDCNCPSFIYQGGRYLATQKGYGLVEENRAPTRDTHGFTICKHLQNVLVNFNNDKIIAALKSVYEPKKEEPKKEEPKKEEPKKEESKKVEPKKEEPKKVEPKVVKKETKESETK